MYRICGFDAGDVRFDEHGLSQSVICECCGNEAGIRDYSVTQIRPVRASCVGSGAMWIAIMARPADWDLRRQPKAVP